MGRVYVAAMAHVGIREGATVNARYGRKWARREARVGALATRRLMVAYVHVVREGRVPAGRVSKTCRESPGGDRSATPAVSEWKHGGVALVVANGRDGVGGIQTQVAVEC